MKTTIAFDVYGTLIDPFSVTNLLQEIVGEKAIAFSKLWRDKQLEYSFRQAAMKKFQQFSHCTHMALVYTDQVLDTQLKEEQMNRLLQAYRQLPAYDQVPSLLQQLKRKNVEVVAFSNGAYDDLIALFQQATILTYFDQIISVDEVQTFKPAPEVYLLLQKKATAKKENTWLVSTNTFDIIGARAVDLKTVWLCKNTKVPLDPFGYQSNLIIEDLHQLVNYF